MSLVRVNGLQAVSLAHVCEVDVKQLQVFTVMWKCMDVCMTPKEEEWLLCLLCWVVKKKNVFNCGKRCSSSTDH